MKDTTFTPSEEQWKKLVKVCSKDKDDKTVDAEEDHVHIYGNNRTGLLVDISKVFTERNIDITTIHSRTNKQGVATIDVSFGVSSKAELADLVTKLKAIESVIDIERTTG